MGISAYLQTMIEKAKRFSGWFKRKLYLVGVEETDGGLTGVRKAARECGTTHGRLRHIYHNLPTGLAAFVSLLCHLRKGSGQSWSRWGKELDDIFLKDDDE